MWTCNPSPDTPQYPNTHPDTELCLAEGRGAPRAWFAAQFSQTFGLKLSWVSSWTKFFWTRHLDWDLTAIASVNFLPLCRADADIKQTNDSFWTILKKIRVSWLSKMCLFYVHLWMFSFHAPIFQFSCHVCFVVKDVYVLFGSIFC